MTSIGTISGAIHQTGPTKCFRYFTPCSLTPMMCVMAKTVRAMAALVLRLAVGGKNPGIRPTRLEMRMKRARVAMRGKYALPFGPMVSSMIPSRPSMTTSMKFWAPVGTVFRERDARKPTTMRMSMTTQV